VVCARRDGTGRTTVTLVAEIIPVAVVAVLLRRGSGDDSTRFRVGLALWIFIATMCVVVPSLRAYLRGKDVPFPRLRDTVRALVDRSHWLAVGLLAALVVLMIHLLFYPWPNIAHTIQNK